MWTEAVQVAISVLTPLAAVVAWWVRRADKREDRMIKNLERQLEEERERTRSAEQRGVEAAKRAQAAKAAVEERASLWERRATLWHGQLLDNEIKPNPRWGEQV